MPRKDQGWITFQTSEEERQLLEAVCQLSQRTKTEVLREMLRGLKGEAIAPGNTPDIAQSDQTGIFQESVPMATKPQRLRPPPDFSDGHAKKLLKVSSRNILEGTIKQLVKGTVHTEVTLEIVHRVELTSTITTTSAEALELAVGKDAYALIKSSDVVIAME